jgi:hypothetical protein
VGRTTHGFSILRPWGNPSGVLFVETILKEGEDHAADT